MALPNFFNRAATAASQVLANFDLASFEKILEKQVVGLAFDASATKTSEGQAALDMSVRLLARLYPTISLLPLSELGKGAVPGLRRLAKSINPDVGIGRSDKRLTVCLAVGETALSLAAPVIYIGSDGWSAKLSRSGPVGCGKTNIPFGAGAAACFGAANLFRFVFRDQLPQGDLDEMIGLSMLSYSPRSSRESEPEPEDIKLDDAHLVGLGAIGNGAVWALARCQNLSGALNLIDHETVDLSNLQRYALSDQARVGAFKVDVAAAALASSRLTITPHPKRWTDYVADRGNWRFNMVAVALDTAADRIAVQGSLPKWIVNAWTQDVDLGVSRHGFANGRACLACLYLPDGKVKDEHQLVADELNMPQAAIEIRGLLQTGTPVSEDFVRRVAGAMNVPADALLQFVGQPLRSFHHGAVCGGLVFKLSGGSAPVRAVVPMSFQSALAGIMLAADLVKHASGRLRAPTTSTRINLLRPLGSHLHDPKAQDRSGRCICHDKDFIDAYRTKYELRQ